MPGPLIRLPWRRSHGGNVRGRCSATFMEKVEYLRKSLGITGASPTAQSVIREANEMMDLETQGTLPDQLDRLMRKFFEAPGP